MRRYAKSAIVKRLLLIEMIARFAKSALRKKWRDQMKKVAVFGMIVSMFSIADSLEVTYTVRGAV